MRKESRQMMIVSGLILAISVLGYVLSMSFPEDAYRFPRIVLVLFAFLGVLLMLSAWKNRRNEDETYCLRLKELLTPAISVVIILSYILLLNVIGFFVTTAVFLVVYMRFLGARKWTTILLSVACVLAFIYLLFTLGLHTPLPTGLLM